jgi:hypothetical protein
MTFDNSKIIYSIRIRIFVVIVLGLVYFGLTYAAKMIKFPLLGMGDTAWTLIVVAIFLIVAFLPMVLDYRF